MLSDTSHLSGGASANPIQPRHGFIVVVESNPPMSQAAVLALLNAGLFIEGTPVKIVLAKVEED